MLTSAYVWLGIVLSQAESPAPAPAPDSGAKSEGTWDIVREVVAPILGTGLVGSLFLMVLFRIKIMPTYVFDQAKTAWEEERARMEKAHEEERERLVASHTSTVDRLTNENVELKAGLKEASAVYTQQVIPTLTRVLDAERELVDLRRDEAAERRRRGSHGTE